jgi:two-component system, chemotaxis family, protein-glutamate methylesterase/glutaminase
VSALRVMVVDDASIFRKIISDGLNSLPDVEVVGTAPNGAVALARIMTLRPDLVLLDIEMPEMNGFEVLQAIRSRGLDVGVIIVSAFTRRGGEMTIRALELGAFDFITKATEGSLEENRESIRASLASVIRTYSRRHEIRSLLKGSGGVPASPPGKPSGPVHPKPSAANDDFGSRMQRLAVQTRASLVVIGISTGGPPALARMLPRLPGDLNVPILIVQHMPALFTASLAESLNDRCALRVKEAEDGETVLPNVAYIAPGGHQMKILPGLTGDPIVRITDDPPENNCRPAVDYLFRSVAKNFAGKACGVIMTGMGDDGTRGLKLLKQGGSRVIAQDEASCVVFGMPREAIEAGVVDIVAPLDGIADEIRRAVKGF